MGIQNIIKKPQIDKSLFDEEEDQTVGSSDDESIDIHFGGIISISDSDVSESESDTDNAEDADFEMFLPLGYQGDVPEDIENQLSEDTLNSFYAPYEPSPFLVRLAQGYPELLNFQGIDTRSLQEVLIDTRNTDQQTRRLESGKAKNRRRNNIVLGKKKARRLENARELALLGESSEDETYDITEYNRTFRFSKILADDDLANKILNPTSDAFEEYSNTNSMTKDSRKHKAESTKMRKLSPAEAFNNLDSSQKTFLRKRNLPMGMVQYLDMCVFSFFENDPTGTYISEPLTSFERMMLHSIAHYYELNSQSFNPENCIERLTKVTNSWNHFNPPYLCLSRYLEEQLSKNLNSSPVSKRRQCRQKLN